LAADERPEVSFPIPRGTLPWQLIFVGFIEFLLAAAVALKASELAERKTLNRYAQVAMRARSFCKTKTSRPTPYREETVSQHRHNAAMHK